MSVYDSDDSDGDKKPSSKKSKTFSYVIGGNQKSMTIPIESLTNVETPNLPLWDFVFKHIPYDQYYYVGVKSLIGEAVHIRVDGSDTISQVRNYYCEIHTEWNGYVHPALNFIVKDTHYILPDDGRSLRELGVEHGTVLFVVDGDLPHTGGFGYPSGTSPNGPHENMYRFTAPPVAAVAAAAVAPIEAMAADSNDPSPTSNESTTVFVRSCIDIHTIVNTPGGTASHFLVHHSQQSHNRDNFHFITHQNGLGVTYFFGEVVPSDHLEKIDNAEVQLRVRDPSSIDPIDMSFRLNETKIGQAEDLDHAMSKIVNQRRFHPGALLSGVFILHENDPREIEQVLHIRHTLLRGGSFGEYFSHITQLDRFQIVELAEQSFKGASLLYFSTKSFPRCDFEDKDFKGEGKGVVYAVGPKWNKRENEILSACIEAHGSDEDSWTLQRGLEQKSCGRFCDIHLNGIKVGFCEEASLGEYFSHFLWARGATQEVGYRFVKTKKRKKRERQVHRKLNDLGLHIAGEHFFPPSGDVTLPSLLDTLINGRTSTHTRVLADMHVTHWQLHQWVKLGYLSHKIIWECVKRGAIMLCADDVSRIRPWNSATQAQKFLSAKPNLGKDGFIEKLESFLKGKLFEDDVDDLGIGTMIVKDIKSAKENKHVTIKTATSEFIAPASLEDAKREFIAIFSEDIYNTVSGDE